ncbi:uncharacterized protein B0P05DRAFT_566883 [Gilbertella persicaria]|uniref:uncharacterized protein n=1 Tax=Gilbertella persicaria TaxID=101096 RepID=UPI00222071C8|nr:uncharacterized protein B0P05DRAFT_566883 [Gilbertella persicaria]KAI8047098.1 hypothetical protein B0P05DRAFT_566883 [Gilbertella persicaria]
MDNTSKEEIKDKAENSSHCSETSSSSKPNQHLSRPKLGPKAHSSPRLPVVAITTTGDSYEQPQQQQENNNNMLRPNFSTRSILNNGNNNMLGISHNEGRFRNVIYSPETTSSSESDSSESDTDINEDNVQEKIYEVDDDDEKINSTATLNRSNSVHRRPSYPLEDSAANTLVEAAMDKDEAKDRHVRFQDHVAESAALVERMLSQRIGPQPSAPDSLGAMMTQRYESRQTEEESEFEPGPTNHGSGSVLASLMKLEAQRHEGHEKKRKQLKIKRKNKQQKKNKKPTSLLDFPIHSNTDPSFDSSTRRPPMAYRPTSWLSGASRPQQRPPLINRPASWLSGVASNKYVVPSLEKRKKTAPSVSRRSSKDSMVTTASQFEPITLDDRIRITFEIANILQKQEFLRKLCKALMHYGCPAHRLEYAMRQVSRTLAVDAEYVYFPSVMLITFIDSTTHTTETHFIRQGQVFEMHRLADIYRLEKLVTHGEVSVDEALEFIDKVSAQPPIYPLWIQPFVYALAAFAGCILFFGGRWKEGGICAALSMVFATNEIFSTFISSFQPIWEITVCVLIGFVARAITKYDFCFTPIAFSSFIVVLPGYPMAVSIIELVSRQLVAGVVRMVYAIIYSFLLGYGVSMGSALYMTIDKSATTIQSDICRQASNAATCISSESQWFNFLLVPLFALAYCVYLRARPPRWPIMIIVSACTYVINYALACWANAPSQILQVVPSLGLGLIGNLLTKFTGKMSFDAMLLGVFYLVPSSLGIKGAIGLFGGTNEVGNQGAGFALAMIESSIGKLRIMLM